MVTKAVLIQLALAITILTDKAYICHLNIRKYFQVCMVGIVNIIKF